MPDPRPRRSLDGLDDDLLGSAAVALAVGELRWTPDVAPAVMDRVSRDAVAYPDHFDRRSHTPPAGPPPLVEAPSLARTIRRLIIFAAIIVLVATLVLVAATANAAGDPAGFASGELGTLARSLLSVTEGP
jgi:hypothetical protein